MADDTRSTINVTIRRSSKSPAIFLAASFTEPAWEPVELDVRPLPPSASQNTTEQTNGHVPAQFEFSKFFEVAPGKHHYKFREGSEGAWFYDKDIERAVDNEGNETNVLVVELVTATKKPTDSPEKEDTEEVSNGAVVPDARKAEEVKLAKGENIVYVKEPNDASVEPSPSTAVVGEDVRDIKDDETPAGSSEKVETVGNNPDDGPSLADTTIGPDVLKADASEAAATEDVTTKQVVADHAQPTTPAQDTEILDEPPAAEKNDGSGAETASKPVPDVSKNPVENSHESLADPPSKPRANENPILEKEPEHPQMENNRVEAIESVEKDGDTTPDADTTAEPTETEPVADKGTSCDDPSPAPEPTETPEPTFQEVVTESAVENKDNAPEAEKPLEIDKEGPAGDSSQPTEITSDIKPQYAEQKTVEPPVEPAMLTSDEVPDSAPAPAKEPEEPTEPVQPVEPSTAVDTPADPEPAHADVVVAEKIPLTNGHDKKETADEPVEAEPSIQQLSETTSNPGIAEPDTTADTISENKAEELVVPAPLEATSPESEQLISKEEVSQAENITDGAEPQEAQADKEEMVETDKPAVDVAEPIAEAAVNDVIPTQPAEGSADPEQQKAEEPLSAVAPEESESESSKPVNDVVSVEDVATKSVDDGTSDTLAIEETSAAELATAAPDTPVVSEATPGQEVTSTPEVPVALETEEPQVSKSEEAAIPEPESVEKQDDSSKPEELDATEVADESAASKPAEELVAAETQDDTVPEPEPASQPDSSSAPAAPDTPVATKEPEIPKSTEDTVPEAKVDSGEKPVEPVVPVETPTAVADEPESSEPAVDAATAESCAPVPETEVVGDHTPEEPVEPEASKSIDNADPTADSTPDVAPVVAGESAIVEAQAAPELSEDPEPKPADPVQAEPATADVPESEVEPIEPETSQPINEMVPEPEHALQSTTSDGLNAPIEIAQPGTSNASDDTVPEAAEPAEPAEPEPTTSEAAEASVKATESETAQPADDVASEAAEIAEPAKPADAELVTETVTVETPDAPEDTQEREAVEPAKDAIAQPEPEPAAATITPDTAQAPEEPPQPETYADADNAVIQPAKSEPEPATEAYVSEAAEAPAESVKPEESEASEASEAVNNDVTEPESVAEGTASVAPEASAEPTAPEALPVADEALVEPTVEAEVDSTSPDSEKTVEEAVVEPESIASVEEQEVVESEDKAAAPDTTPADAPDASEASTSPAVQEGEAGIATSTVLESNVREEATPVAVEDVDTRASVQEPETLQASEAHVTCAASEPASGNDPKATEAPVPAQEPEDKNTEIPTPTAEPEVSKATNDAVPDHAVEEVATNDNLADSTNAQPDTIVTELPVIKERVEDATKPVIADEPLASEPEEPISNPEPIAAEQPDDAIPDEPKVAPPEAGATVTEPETNEPNEVTETAVEPEIVEPEAVETERPTVNSATPAELPQQADASAEIAQGIPEPPAEKSSTDLEITPCAELVSETVSTSEPVTEHEPEDVTEPTTAVAIATETDASASKDLEAPEISEHVQISSVEPAGKEDGLEPPTGTAALEPSATGIVTDELEESSRSAEEPAAPALDEVPESQEPEAPKQFAVEIVQPASLNTANYPLIETPIVGSMREPVVADDKQEPVKEAPPETQAKPELEVPDAPSEEQIVEVNGTTPKASLEDVPQEPIEESAAANVAAATLATAVVGAGITQLVSDTKEPVADKYIPSPIGEAPAEVVTSAVEASSSSIPEATPSDKDMLSAKANTDKAVVNGNKPAPVLEADVDAAENVFAPAKAQEEPLAKAAEPVEPPKQPAAEPSTKNAEIEAPVTTAISQTEPISSESTEPEPTTKPSESSTADSTTATTELSPALAATKPAGSGGPDGSRPPTAGNLSATSITIHKRENFFKALWHTIFTSFFGGFFSVFRRGRRDTPRQ
ncbi:hypothetical protein ACJ73_00761 [Blastomyces percursus]|uniref:AMP-activated protein kinase glycogen-binding domain-containing protein n=1 Tax=Blastomyces percursus TaxID=1658174 RepID=A0A1J9QH96_9EURO|nr:hypothetical protein ACJ73_00761 [Blastomyces percursus]